MKIMENQLKTSKSSQCSIESDKVALEKSNEQEPEKVLIPEIDWDCHCITTKVERQAEIRLAIGNYHPKFIRNKEYLYSPQEFPREMEIFLFWIHFGHENSLEEWRVNIKQHFIFFVGEGADRNCRIPVEEFQDMINQMTKKVQALHICPTGNIDFEPKT